MASARASREEVLAGVGRTYAGGRQPTMNELAAAAGVSLSTLYRLFGSRETLLRELEVELPPSTRERVLDAAYELVGHHGLSDLAMDEVAARAGVSRATLYRLFPGKSELFRDLLRRRSRWEVIAGSFEAMWDRPPAEVMPATARAIVAATTRGGGLLLPLLSELNRGTPEITEGATYAAGRWVDAIGRYLTAQMDAGRLRRMDPMLAFTAFAGPIAVYLLTRPLAERYLGVTTPVQDAVDELVQAWLRAMAPDGSGAAMDVEGKHPKEGRP